MSDHGGRGTVEASGSSRVAPDLVSAADGRYVVAAGGVRVADGLDELGPRRIEAVQDVVLEKRLRHERRSGEEPARLMFSFPLSTMTGGLSRTRAAASADIGPLTNKRPIGTQVGLPPRIPATRNARWDKYW